MTSGSSSPQMASVAAPALISGWMSPSHIAHVHMCPDIGCILAQFILAVKPQQHRSNSFAKLVRETAPGGRLLC